MTMKLRLEAFLAVTIQRKSAMTSLFSNGYDVMNCFAKFDKFLPQSIIVPGFMTVRGQITELDLGGTPYNLGLKGRLVTKFPV